MEDGWTRVARFDALQDGEVQAARAGTTAVLLVRRGDEVFATEALCPHKFGPLEEGHLEDGCLVCPLHEGHFDPATGEPREGDEWAGTLTTYAVRVRDGAVEVHL